MKHKKKILVVLAILAVILLAFVGGQAYAKYVTEVKGEGIAEVATWDFKVNGQKEILSLTLQKDVVDPDDVEMLQDLIVTCLNQAFKQVDDAQAASMGKYNIPGLM